LRIRPSLSLKISLLAFLNVSLLVLVFFLFARFQFRFELDSFLFAPARDRILSASRLLALELAEEPLGRWNDALLRHAKSSSAQIYLFADDGRQLAGPFITLPDSVRSSLARGHHGRRPGSERFRVPPRLGPPPLFLVHTSSSGHEYWVGVPIPILGSSHPEPLHGAVIWQFSSLWTNPFFFDYRPWLAAILAVVLISVACWLPLIRGLTRAISQMTSATAQIAQGHFEIALPTTRGDELGQLSISINRMAQRLSDFVQGQRRFLSDIAHELCSPIARMQVALGILHHRASEDTIGYVSDVAEEATHVSGLISELLSFSKAEIGTTQTQFTPVNVAEVSRRVVEREGSNEATVEIEIDPELEVIAQPECLLARKSGSQRNPLYASGSGPISVSAAMPQRLYRFTCRTAVPGFQKASSRMCSSPFTGLNLPDSAKREVSAWG